MSLMSLMGSSRRSRRMGSSGFLSATIADRAARPLRLTTHLAMLVRAVRAKRREQGHRRARQASSSRHPIDRRSRWGPRSEGDQRRRLRPPPEDRGHHRPPPIRHRPPHLRAEVDGKERRALGSEAPPPRRRGRRRQREPEKPRMQGRTTNLPLLDGRTRLVPRGRRLRPSTVKGCEPGVHRSRRPRSRLRSPPPSEVQRRGPICPRRQSTRPPSGQRRASGAQGRSSPISVIGASATAVVVPSPRGGRTSSLVWATPRLS